MTRLAGLRIGLIGPLPPPYGGMANQTKQLANLLRSEGAEVEVVQVNRPYRPEWIGKAKGARALSRAFPFVRELRNAARRVQVFHVMANSGWSWHLFASPAVWIARTRGIPCVVNYHGGNAEPFFKRSFAFVRPTLQVVNVVVVPSTYLENVFTARGFRAVVVPNVVDLERFSPDFSASNTRKWKNDTPEILIARNLEPLYDVQTALRAFHIVSQELPGARLKIAGSGSEEAKVTGLVRDLGLQKSVTFLGRVDNEDMPSLYRSADLVVNPSLVDNMPISILEALASGVAVVSTAVGGIPLMVEDGKNALLVPPGQPNVLAESVLVLLRDSELRGRIQQAGLEVVQQYRWSSVRDRWANIYSLALEGNGQRNER